nr:family 43 glycosylhydrolase [Paenibacillus sambharensis]
MLLTLTSHGALHAEQNTHTYENPIIWADVPDPDVIRVGDAYYMSSTTMHMNPGVPIMKSYDLVHWNIVNYVYDILADNDEQALRNGKSNYSKGSWASSLRYHNGTFYLAFASYDTGKTYIYQTSDIERGPWTHAELDGVYHDMSLLFDDDGRVYMVYGGGDIRIIELTADATAIKPGGMDKVIIPDASRVAGENIGLKAEGTHIQKINGYYYVFNITWPSGGMRTQIVHRSDTIDGTYTGKVALKDAGIAQGGLVDTQEGSWYAMLFGDRGSVGRIPYLVPVTWEDNWPVFGVDGKVPQSLVIPAGGEAVESNWVASDEFYNSAASVGISRRAVSYSPVPADSSAAPTVQPSAAVPVKDIIVNSGFESGLEPWSGHQNATVTVTTDQKFSGTSSLFVSGREGTGSGPQQMLTGKVKAGGVYEFSAKVMYDGDETLPASRVFNIAYQDGDWQTIKVMGSVTINKGEWGTIEGTYTIPPDAALNNPLIFIETSWTSAQDPVKDRMDFYVDDVSFIDVTPAGGMDKPQPGEYDHNGSSLALAWQWNHNPDNRNWSLTERPGYLRLTTGKKSTNLLDARNTLTQRTFGPESSGSVAVEVGQMKNGDYTGLALLQKEYGYVGVKMSGNAKSIVMVNGSTGTAVEAASVPLTQERVYLKAEADFRNQTDKANFYYSLDGTNWTKIGDTLQMRYTLPHFMGYRFALFNYATAVTGGYVDFDYYRIGDKLTGEGAGVKELQAELGHVSDVSGVPNIELEVPLRMDELPAGDYRSILASFNIPDALEVTGVTFNEANIDGAAAFSTQGNRLQLQVTGEETNFTHHGSNLFATIHLRVADFAPTDRTVVIRTDYIRAEGGSAVYNVHQAAAHIGLKTLNTTALAKVPGYHNPLVSHKFGADPFAMVFDGRVYIYMTNDEYEYDANGNIVNNTYGKINTITVISSADMVNWTDHGAIPVAGPNGAAKWASNSWAPAAAHKVIDGKDKFFLYFANNGSGIGVLTADSPVGPWTDPIGKPLVSWSTPGVRGVVWLFDPAVLVDDDGKGYLYFGGGLPGGSSPTPAQISNPRTSRVIELADNMIETAGSAVEIDAPYMFEDSGIHKFNGKYYYSYCSNFAGVHPEGTPPPGEIAYMVSDSPMGPFTYVAPILKNPSTFFGVGGNNHHSIFEFQGEWYIAYHAQTVSKAALGDGKGYRSTHINKVDIYDSGYIRNIQADMKGVPAIANLNPYKRVEAETFAWNAGIRTSAANAPANADQPVNLYVTDVHDGDWFAVANVDFGDTGAKTFEAGVSAAAGGTLEIRLDSPNGQVIGKVKIAPSKGKSKWKVACTELKQVSGVRHLFFTFKGAKEERLMDIDYWSLKKAKSRK